MAKRPRVGSIEFQAEQEYLPDGPCDPGSLFGWTNVAWQRLLCLPGVDQRMVRLKKLCETGIMLTSHYSGKGTVETALTHISLKLQVEGLLENPGVFGCDSACDSDQLCRDVLVRLAHDDRRVCTHVFGDILGRVSLDTQSALAALEPAEHLSPEDASFCYQAMWEFLKEGVENNDVFDDEQRSPCSQCEKDCSLFCRSVATSAVHGMVAGTTCRDFATYGHKLGLAGKHMKPFLVWCAEIRYRRPLFCLHEITATAPATLLDYYLGDLYSIVTGVIDPVHFGWPAILGGAGRAGARPTDRCSVHISHVVLLFGKRSAVLVSCPVDVVIMSM